MEKTKKISQALVVIIVVGIGLIHNVYTKTNHLNPYNPFSFSIENQAIKADSLKNNENSLYVYTKKIIDSGIKRLISNL